MTLRFSIVGFAAALAGCSERPANSVPDFRPRQEVAIPDGVTALPGDEHFETARRVFASLKRYKDTDMWIAEEKLSVFGRDFELRITGSEDAPSRDYIQRLAETLSVVEGLKAAMEPPLCAYYKENKRFVEAIFGSGIVPEISNASELWAVLDFGILAFNSLNEEIAAKSEGRETEKLGGMTFSLLGDQPWNAEDGTVISVRGGKIIVDSDASLIR